MTLAHKMLIKTALIALLLAGLVGVGYWGIIGLSNTTDQASEGLEDLSGQFKVTLEAFGQYRQLLLAAAGLYNARNEMRMGRFDDTTINERLEESIRYLEQFKHEYGEDDEINDILAAVRELQREYAGATPLMRRIDAESYIQRITHTFQIIGKRMTEARERIDATQDAVAHRRTRAGAIRTEAAKQRNTTMILLGLIGAAVIAAVVVIAVSQYRAVMGPMKTLRDGVRRVAGGEFDRPVEATGDVEFQELAREFNRMAAELHELYRSLEDKVRQKSNELVRSERLASVGYLAAGVAHEINNPLGIIAGYAELSLKKLSSSTDVGATIAHARETLEIARDEAFRCKGIIEKLLSLSRGGDESRSPVSLRNVAEEVATLVGALKAAKNRTLEVDFNCEDEGCLVIANANELKQVLLNLVVNALEATDAGRGVVKVTGKRVVDTVRLTVADNGRGMDEATLQQVFEPFYSQTVREGKRGTGLGLSITHAIVENLQGQLRAESDGLGKGSRFIVELPAADAVQAEPAE